MRTKTLLVTMILAGAMLIGCNGNSQTSQAVAPDSNGAPAERPAKTDADKSQSDKTIVFPLAQQTLKVQRGSGAVVLFTVADVPQAPAETACASDGGDDSDKAKSQADADAKAGGSDCSSCSKSGSCPASRHVCTEACANFAFGYKALQYAVDRLYADDEIPVDSQLTVSYLGRSSCVKKAIAGYTDRPFELSADQRDQLKDAKAMFLAHRADTDETVLFTISGDLVPQAMTDLRKSEEKVAPSDPRYRAAMAELGTRMLTWPAEKMFRHVEPAVAAGE